MMATLFSVEKGHLVGGCQTSKRTPFLLGPRGLCCETDNEQNVIRKFFWALLNSSWIFNQASMRTSGSTVEHVNSKNIKKFHGICPPIELQNNFATILTKLSH